MLKNLEWFGTGICALTTLVQTNQALQVVSIILTCITAGVTLAYTIWKWFRKAKSDGKIDEEDIKELADEINEINDKIKKEINK